MNKLFEILRKNILLLTRSKTSSLIVLLGPLLLILLISTAFNTTSLYDIKIGSYSDEYSPLSESIMEQLSADEFRVEKLSSKDICINSIKTNDVHVCSFFPSGLSIDSKENIEFYVDTSRMNLVYVVLNSVSSRVSTKSTELSTALTSTLLNTIESTDSKVSEGSSTITQVSANLQQIKNDISDSLSVLELSLNASDLEDDAVELNLTGDAGTLISSYQKLVNELDESLTKTLGAASSISSIEAEIKNVQVAIGLLSEIKERINSIDVKEVWKIVSPIRTEIKTVSSEDSTHFTYTFPILLVIVLLFSGLLVSSTAVMEEKSSKAFFRNFITPTSNALFVVGNFISNLLIVIMQILVIFLAMYIFSRASIPPGILVNLVIITILTASIFILIGMLIGYIFKSGETSNLAVITIASIMLFFSNTILPLETLHPTVMSVAGFNPFILGSESLKEILLFNAPLSAISNQFYILLGYFVVLFILVLSVRGVSKRRYIE